jgi:antitoxin (DNA-binding transcriptional repressor) of toxin-antitoxin stability system
MPRKLPFDVAVGSLHELVEGMVPGEELVLTEHGEPTAILTWDYSCSSPRVRSIANRKVFTKLVPKRPRRS